MIRRWALMFVAAFVAALGFPEPAMANANSLAPQGEENRFEPASPDVAGSVVSEMAAKMVVTTTAHYIDVIQANGAIGYPPTVSYASSDPPGLAACGDFMERSDGFISFIDDGVNVRYDTDAGPRRADIRP